MRLNTQPLAPFKPQRELRKAHTHYLLLWAGISGLLAVPFSGKAQRFEFRRITPGVIEDRLRRVKDRNPEREKTLQALFEEAGCTGELLAEQPVKGARTPNVICTLTGTEDSTVIVGAHYDKVENGHGVVDNWSGVSLLPSLFQGLNAKPRRLTFVFIGFTDEEKGLIGSKFYASQLSREQREKIRAMVNIDSLGVSDTKVWLSYADKRLAATAFGVAHSLNLPLAAVNVEKVGFSDAGPFREKKIPSIDFHSLTQETLPILHSYRDTLSAIQMPEYQKSYTLLGAYLACLDVSLNPGSDQRQDPAAPK